MKTYLRNISLVTLLLTGFYGSVALSGAPTLNPNEMREVMDIATRIHKLQPNLDEGKYLEYATGIYRASVTYEIDSDTLLAITKQETSFREDLPEGAAGELGICQIRKMWVSQPDFKREFPKAKVKDLMRPAKSFMFAAWILKELKSNAKKSSIPFWSFYNAKKFEPRLRYYTAVSRHLNALNRYDGGDRQAALPIAKKDKKRLVASWSPEPIRYTNASLESADWSKSKKQNSPESSWIASAIKKLQEKKKKKNNLNLTDGALVQAGAEFSVMKNIFSNQIAKD